MELALSGWAILIAGSAVAGWVDAMIGGGGLILIPLIMAVMPGMAPASVVATNKVAAVTGTASAAVTYVKKVPVPRKLALAYIPLAMVASGFGALVAAMISKDVMRPLVIVLMLVVGSIVALRPSFGQTESDSNPALWRRLASLLGVAAIAFYDGIFGPGTGMFLIMVFTGILSQDFLASTALTKVVNTATNLGALAVFAIGGHIWWQLGLTLAVANVVGAQIGARTVLGGGTKLIRMLLLAMVVVMSSYLAWQQWG
ncbi:TSUP family transporter [Corynebacterium sp. H130]|uniref:TSUP family transporter n=1 Tax=Corynebacterium sp. H130 TaxID=3133444 RepID=UPI0030B4B937